MKASLLHQVVRRRIIESEVEAQMMRSGDLLVTNVQELSSRRDRLFNLHRRGYLTNSETSLAFLQLLAEADGDEEACELCYELPAWFRSEFRDCLEELHASICPRNWGCLDCDCAWEEDRCGGEFEDFVQRVAPRILLIFDCQ